ncbi:ribosomal RNA small subunit methyltransferase A [Patescibacteria group bacterium]|nr:ribosomal RNA small subunit methyltransferase A [Patescibacteria group bacterium]
MDLLFQTKFFIKKTGLKPDKLKGQNFCVDEEVIKEMVRVAQVSNKDMVLEVGPGFGFLTAELLKKAKQVMAVELEKKLIGVLKRLEKVHQNLEVVEGDIFKIPNYKFKNSYKIVSNLPYSITSAFLKKFLTADNKPQAMTLLIQKEVAERICAKPGQMSRLALSVQLYGRPQIIKIVSPESFWPQPKVASAILQIDNIMAFPYADRLAEKDFWRIVRSGFCSKRKQLHNNLAGSLQLPADKVKQILLKLSLDPKIRAQELSINNWVELSCYVAKLLC